MASRDFEMVGATSTKPHEMPEAPIPTLMKNAFRLETLALFGALIQIALVATLPYRVALLPAAALTLNALIKTGIQASRPSKNSFMDKVNVGGTTAQLPSTENGQFGHEPADKPVVVFHFGVRHNHPLGMLAPGAPTASKLFFECMENLNQRKEELGLLGYSTWIAGERASNNTLMYIFYFTNVEGLHKFAAEEIHTKAVKWVFQWDIKHLTFFHETFSVPRKSYESIYLNSAPMLMGATSIKCPDEEGEERYVQPLVEVTEKGPLRTMYNRMGRTKASV